MRLETLLGAGVGFLLRAVYMVWVFAPYPAARYVDTAPLVVLGALLSAYLAERFLQLISRPRRYIPTLERSFGASLFFSTAIFIEFGKIAGEYSVAGAAAVWCAAFVCSFLLSNLWTRSRRYARLAASRHPQMAAPFPQRAAAAPRFKKAKKTARRAYKPSKSYKPYKVAPRPRQRYDNRKDLLYKGRKHQPKRRRAASSSRKRAYGYGRRQPARAV